MEQTHETHNGTDPLLVIDFLEGIMRREISNPVSRRGNTLTVSLSDHTMVKIAAPKVSRDTQPPVRTEATIENIATLKYVLQHDYGYGEEPERTELKRLELRHIDDCRTYIADACRSQLNAYFTDFLVEFYNGDKFMITVKIK